MVISWNVHFPLYHSYCCRCWEQYIIQKEEKHRRYQQKFDKRIIWNPSARYAVVMSWSRKEWALAKCPQRRKTFYRINIRATSFLQPVPFENCSKSKKGNCTKRVRDFIMSVWDWRKEVYMAIDSRHGKSKQPTSNCEVELSACHDMFLADLIYAIVAIVTLARCSSTGFSYLATSSPNQEWDIIAPRLIYQKTLLRLTSLNSCLSSWCELCIIVKERRGVLYMN